jgi:N-acetylglucosaminyl-diphospho-decaprenol L-rhamnosyltransferase
MNGSNRENLKINIVILNYNGRELLKECLPSIKEAARKSKFRPSVTVLDNCSTDGSIELLKEEFPSVNVFKARENKVYCSYNEFFEKSKDDIILILNSDIKVEDDFLDPLLEHFVKNHDVFFVASRMYYFDKKTYQGDLSRAVERFGIISADTRFKGYDLMINKPFVTFSTGNGAFDRKKFLKLGGFDEIYLPGRYEDVDFCYRGWKSGYRGIYEPDSIIYHKGYASFKEAFSSKEIDMTVFRNSLLFMWKNISDYWMLLIMHIWLLPRLLFFMLTGRFYFIKAFFYALSRMSTIIRRRKIASKTFKLNDRQVLAMVGQP